METGKYAVRKSDWAHGAHTPETPWHVVQLSPPSTPGEPRDGIRYMIGYATRERAIEEAAKNAAGQAPRYRDAMKRALAVFAEETERARELLERETEAE